MKVIAGILSLLLLATSQHLHAGYSSSESKYYKFRYDVRGEIEVRPDRAVFPLIIKARAVSYERSLNAANQVVNQLDTEARKLDADKFSVDTNDYARETRRRSKINLSFFGNDSDDKKRATSRVVSYLVLYFSDADDFSRRATLVAKALDFINAFNSSYEDNRFISISSDEVFYEISDVEQYREQVVSSVYQKARNMAAVIGKQEKLKPVIKDVHFDQHITEEILSFNKAALSVGAKIEYRFIKN